jgi:hypothetical protein
MLGGVVGILRGLSSAPVFLGSKQILQLGADVLVALAELAVRSFECTLETAPTGVLDQDRLLSLRGRPLFNDQSLGEPDGSEIVSGLLSATAALG